MDDAKSRPSAVVAADAPPRSRPTSLPPELATRLEGRVRRPLGELFGITHFGVNLTRLAPGAISSPFHRHTRQEELVYVLAGHPTLVTDGVETPLAPGMCAGFPAGGPAHQLVNRGTEDVLILEIGDRGPGDEVSYPDDDLRMTRGPDGKLLFTRKDGSTF